MMTLRMTLSDFKRPKLPKFVIFTASHIFVMDVRNFKFGLQVDGSKSQPADVKPSLKRTWSGLRDTLEFYTT